PHPTTTPIHYTLSLHDALPILSVHRNMDFESEPKEYKVSVRTNDIHKAIAKTGTALAALVDEALLSHEPHEIGALRQPALRAQSDRKSTRLNSSHRTTSYAVFC